MSTVAVSHKLLSQKTQKLATNDVYARFHFITHVHVHMINQWMPLFVKVVNLNPFPLMKMRSWNTTKVKEVRLLIRCIDSFPRNSNNIIIYNLDLQLNASSNNSFLKFATSLKL